MIVTTTIVDGAIHARIETDAAPPTVLVLTPDQVVRLVQQLCLAASDAWRASPPPQ